MSFDYTRMQDTADRLFAKFGQTATITSTDAAGAVTTRITSAVKVGTVTHTLDNSGISIGDDELYVDPAGNPQPGQRIAYGNESRVIVDPVVAIQPATTVLAYRCWARLG